MMQPRSLTAPRLHTSHRSFPAERVETTGQSIRQADVICKTRDVLLLPFIHAQVEPKLSVLVDIKDDYKI